MLFEHQVPQKEALFEQGDDRGFELTNESVLECTVSTHKLVGRTGVAAFITFL